MPKSKHNMVDVSLIVICTLLVVITLLPLGPLDHWLSTVWEFPRAQIAALAVVCALAGLYTEQYWVVVSCCLVAIYQGVWVLPYTFLYPKEVQRIAPSDSSVTLKIINSNVLMDNRSADKLIRLVNQHQPDVLVTLESDMWWQEALAPLHPSYPYRVNRPLDNLYGMHVLSKYPLEEVQVKELIEPDIPSIHCYIRLNETVRVNCHFLHPAPPSPTENTYATPRDRELLLIAKEIADKQGAIVVTGDLNDVAWSPTTRAFRRISGLLDPRIGRGMYNTFHAAYLLLRWPLDHLFHSEHFALVTLRRLPSIDSDHFPLLTELAYVAKSTTSDELQSPP